MQAERTYLVKYIFPHIKRECLKRNIEFSVIDLRWGLVYENEGSIIGTCLDLIDKTNPFFIGLLGDRYGWIPLKRDLLNNIKLVQKHPEIIDYVEHNLSITEMEMRYGVLDRATNTKALFFFRKHKSNKKERCKDGYEKLGDLKQKIFEASIDNKCQVNEYSSLKELGYIIYDRIMAIINEIYPVNANQNNYQIILEKQECKWKELQHVYIDYSDRVKSLTSYLKKTFSNNLPAIVIGDNGSGKSALLANYTTDEYTLIKTIVDDDVYNLNILIQLFEEAKKQLQNRTTPILWIIDGLEKLLVRISDFKIIFDQKDCFLLLSMNYEMYKKLWKSYNISSSYDILSLTDREVKYLIQNNLEQYSKKLTSPQLDFICSKDFLKQPYLCKVFINLLIQFGVYEELDLYISNLLNAENDVAFVSNIISSIEYDFGAKEVSRILSFLGASEIAFPEQSLCEVSGVPISKWIPIQTALDDLIVYEGGYLMAIRVLRIAIKQTYYPHGPQLSLCMKIVRLLKNDNISLFKKPLLKINKNWIINIYYFTINWLLSYFHYPLECENKILQLRKEKNILNIINLLYDKGLFKLGAKYLDKHFRELNDYPIQRILLLAEAFENGISPSRFVHFMYNESMDIAEWGEFMLTLEEAYSSADTDLPDWKIYLYDFKVTLASPDTNYYFNKIDYIHSKDTLDINSWINRSYISETWIFLSPEKTYKKSEALPFLDKPIYLLDISDVEKRYNNLILKYSELNNITLLLSKNESTIKVPWILPMYAFYNLRIGNLNVAKQVSMFLNRKGIPFPNLDFEIAYLSKDLIGLQIALEDIENTTYVSHIKDIFKIQCRILYYLVLNEKSHEKLPSAILEVFRLVYNWVDIDIIVKVAHWLKVKNLHEMSNFLQFFAANRDSISSSCKKVFQEFNFISFLIPRKYFYIKDIYDYIIFNKLPNRTYHWIDVFINNGIITKKIKNYKVNHEKIKEYLFGWQPPFQSEIFNSLLASMKMLLTKSTPNSHDY